MTKDIITPFAEIIEECKQMQAFLDITPSDNINEIVERGNELLAYLARSGKLVADADYHLNEMRKSEIMQIIKQIIPEKFSAKVQNALVDSIAKEQKHVALWCDRINRTATHQLDWCRTLISKAKVEMQNLNFRG